MATENRKDPRRNFAPRVLPWLLAAAALIFYGFTLNHWVSLLNLGFVAKISGWSWQPEVVNPFIFLATYPFRWLPAAQIPIALNFFSAACAAATLGLLARSVALLPHDRTDAQRKREQNVFLFLTIRSAWLPPLLAVAVCGLQFIFWEHATSFTGETFQLLVFAFIIWLLLEYRLDEREGRLHLAALIYGAGMADNFALAGFLPVFVAAIIWLRGLSFFNWQFLKRMILCGLWGMSLYLLLPLLATISGKYPITFREVLKFNLGSQWQVVKMFFLQPEGRLYLALMSLTSLFPIFAMAIRWASSFGDSSALGTMLAGWMFHLVHAVIFILCVWVAFDPPFSPHHFGFGLPVLTFYYLVALNAGYYGGYLLLVCGRRAASGRPQKQIQPQPQLSNHIAVAAFGIFVLLVVTGLLYKNLPQIHSVNGDTFKKYSALMTESLPRAGGILLSDDSRRLILVQAALTRDGRAKDFVPVDTQFLLQPAYHRYLHEKFSSKWPDTISAAERTNGISPLHLISLLATLARTNDLYYLHPSFGYYFEQFYLEPHGLVYKLNTLPAATLLPPPLARSQIAENEDFWSQAETEAFSPIVHELTPINPRAPKNFGERLLARLHATQEPDPNLILAGTFYSRSLDFWGVELQRAGEFETAAARFQLAQKVNPDNVVAQINLEFNKILRAGKTVPMDLSKATGDQLGKYRDWNEAINVNGPFDEPNFCFQDGIYSMGNNYNGQPMPLLRQALIAFTRVQQLEPDFLHVRFLLAQIYIFNRLPDGALEALQQPLLHPEAFGLSETNSTELSILAAGAYFQKDDATRAVQLLEAEISRHPTNTDLLIAAAKAYTLRGLFTNALKVVDLKLKSSPDDPAWLLNRGYLRIQLKHYGEAIADLNRVLVLQTTNSRALYFRASAYLASDDLTAARADFETLQQSFANSFQVAYDLGEIAWRKHDTNEAIRNYAIYLANANTNTAEATNIIQRLREFRK
jgi:tetratricopeptide (TPR) repeat protein